MKIIADEMLGKLTRWLRIEGLSVEYARGKSDKSIIAICKRNKAILLTADIQLSNIAKKRGVKCLIVNNSPLEKEVARVLLFLGVQGRLSPGSVCPICNSKLEKKDKKELKDLKWVDGEVYWCRKCKKAYWHGSHWKDIEKRMKKINEELKSMSLLQPPLR
ncbi:MAG: Mut7-C RNAse domain-containing protein [Candidatus Micrarchaeaceae archaeon]